MLSIESESACLGMDFTDGERISTTFNGESFEFLELAGWNTINSDRVGIKKQGVFAEGHVRHSLRDVGSFCFRIDGRGPCGVIDEDGQIAGRNTVIQTTFETLEASGQTVVKVIGSHLNSAYL